MPKARSVAQWQALKPDYRSRLEAKGLSRADYIAGVNLSAFRGHANTPERPSRVHTNVARYEPYIARKEAKGEGISPRAALARTVFQRNVKLLKQSGRWINQKRMGELYGKLSLEELQKRASMSADDMAARAKAGDETYYYK